EAIAQGQHTVTGIIMTSPAKLMVVLDVRITSVQVSTEKVMELTFIDVTEQYVKNKALSEIAFKDELTGLFNHRSFYQRLNEEIQHARENDRSLVLLFVDLDNFKRCNDTYGHQIGDQLLRNVGGLVRDHIRQDRDAGFRYGGDEFAVLLPEARVNVAERIAHQVREGFESIEQYGTSMSIGVAEWKEGMDAEALVKSADGALYAAKSAGKNTVRISE
ncbi:MAG: GGDEF domain-containing protein, partial [Candidatus Hydrogenedentes bacterium]|nr:GGDEF domain-containing protein [Candidatus Hydrogenedentota bacterium]